MAAADDAGSLDGLRQRRAHASRQQATPSARGDGESTKKTVSSDNCKLQTGTFWLTRIVLLRYIGFIYFVAFLVALHQNGALLGSTGLLPADKFLREVRAQVGEGGWQLATAAPTLLWLVDIEDGQKVDVAMTAIAYAGLALSAFVLLLGRGNWPIMLTLWALYHSLVNVGQRWYSFGWESQLLETGFLACFLCPVWSLRAMPPHTPTPYVVILALRWLIFRIMLGAGLIKIRGDKCWRDLTCMNYHYETQPVPNPMSWYLHQSPELFHQFETLTNHFVELVAPFLLVGPRRLCMAGGAIQILFQVVLIVSGNLSFLNWLTIFPSLACFDDASLQRLFPRQRLAEVAALQQSSRSSRHRQPLGVYMRRTFNIALGLLIAYLSIPVVQNLLSTRQAMNTSFDPLRLVNTYGAFGSVTKRRTEVVFQGSRSTDPSSPRAQWLEYEFKCKPGNVSRTPCLLSPYHYRLDWLLWFAAFQNYQHNPWLIHLAAKLLANDPQTESLIAHNPFHGQEPPRYIRVEHYRYRYTKLGSGTRDWWRRKHLGNYLPPVSLESLRPLLTRMGWSIPQPHYPPPQ